MLVNPSHTYFNQGIYDVTLVASSTICEDTLRKTNHITVDGSLSVDFSTNTPTFCLDDTVVFQNQSSEFANDFTGILEMVILQFFPTLLIYMLNLDYTMFP